MMLALQTPSVALAHDGSARIELNREQTSWMMNKCPHHLKFKLLLFDVWAQLYLRAKPREAVLSQLRQHLEIINPGYTGFLN